MLNSERKRAFLVVLAGVALVGPLIFEFFTKPESLRPFVGVFGERPFGLPANAGASLTVLAIAGPLLGALSQGIELAVRLSQLEGRAVMGKIGLMLAMRRHWDDERVRERATAAGRWLALFVIATAAWIAATAAAGV